jgi:biofilm PGA synthesis N-glycosyltransferase PgaC
MIEAFKYHPKVLFRKRLSTFFIWWDLLFPAMDVAFTFGFLPGLVLAMFGYFWIVGPMTLILLPMALIMNSVMYRIEEKMFSEQHLHVRRNTLGFFLYMLPYSCILQPAAVWGYITEIFGTKNHGAQNEKQTKNPRSFMRDDLRWTHSKLDPCTKQ